MDNPFEIILEKLEKIENLLLEQKEPLPKKEDILKVIPTMVDVSEISFKRIREKLEEIYLLKRELNNLRERYKEVTAALSEKDYDKKRIMNHYNNIPKWIRNLF